MKKFLAVLSILVLTTISAKADSLFRAHGLIYEQTTSPFSEYFDSSIKPQKSGEANCVSYFLLVTKGDCSISRAMKDAGITKINHIDRIDKNILFYHKVSLLVSGE